MNKIACKDLGSSCRFEAKADNVDQLLALFEDHAQMLHHLKFLSFDLEDRVRELAQKENNRGNR